MSDIKLSFCIPTYNRSNYIRQTLTSISDQIIEAGWTDCIEICVSDNASTDNTDEEIHNFQADYPSVKLVYSKNDENLGADRNYLRVVELASGEYCWLFGSDDALVPGAVKSLLSEIKHKFDIYLCNRVDCNNALTPVRKYCWLDIPGDRVYDFALQSELEDYFRSARSIGAVFSYLSSIIVRKSQWNAVTYDTSMTGTAYSHVYILVSLMVNGATLKYLQDTMVYCRFGNDSFALDGAYKRFMIDLVGYSKIATKLLENNEAKSEFLKIMTREQPLNRLAKIRFFYKDKWSEVKGYLNYFEYSKFTIISAEVIGSVPYLVGLMLRVKRTFTRLR